MKKIEACPCGCLRHHYAAESLRSVVGSEPKLKVMLWSERPDTSTSGIGTKAHMSSICRRALHVRQVG